MAIKAGAEVTSEAGVKLVSWASVTEADTGKSMAVGGQFTDKTVQVYGSFGTSGAITIEGTNDPAESLWGTLHDFQGNTLVLTDGSVKLIAENPLRIRPRATAGTGMNVTVAIAASD